MKLRNHADGRLHWSDLKRFGATCPARAIYDCSHPAHPSPAMRFGSLVDRFVFGGNVVRFSGTRRGKLWDTFVASCPTDAVIASDDEYDRGRGAADAVLSHAHFADVYRRTKHQVCHTWDWNGFPCATGVPGVRGGFDMIGRAILGDLKVTSSTEPSQWMRHADRMLYPEQLAFYASAASDMGNEVGATNMFLFGVEARPPHVVTVLQMTQHRLDMANDRLRLWAEHLRACESADEWPGYTQSNVMLEGNDLGLVIGDDTDEEDR